MLLHNEPILRHSGKAVPLASSSGLFFASDVNTWAHLIKQDRNMAAISPSCSHTRSRAATTQIGQITSNRCLHSIFTAYMLLEGIGASICEDRIQGLLTMKATERYERDLISWYTTYRESIKERSDPLCLLVLWHSVFMSLLADFHSLELVIGKEGPAAAAAAKTTCTLQWCDSVDLKRCLIHAFLLQKLLQSQSLGSSMAIHIPRCLFSSAVAWSGYLACTTKYDQNAPHKLPLSPWQLSIGDMHSFPEIKMLALDIPRHWLEDLSIQSGNVSSINRNTLCILADMLRKLGQWGIGRKFARIIAFLIHEAENSTFFKLSSV